MQNLLVLNFEFKSKKKLTDFVIKNSFKKPLKMILRE